MTEQGQFSFPYAEHADIGMLSGFGTVYVVKHPSTLTVDVQQYLFEILFPVALSAFNREETDSFVCDVRCHVLNGCSLMFLAAQVGKRTIPKAFCIWDTIESEYGRVLMLSGICVLQEFQGKHIGKGFISFALKHFKEKGIDFIVLRTQNPVMKKTLDSALGKESFPLIDCEIPDMISSVAQCVADALGDFLFNPQTLVSKGVYGKSLYGGELPSVEEPGYKRLFSEVIAPHSGDAMYCIASI